MVCRLFDYFNDKTFVAILKKMKNWLKPGGEIVVGNFNDNHNPSRNYMEILGEWYLEHRSENTLKQLALKARFEELGISFDAQEALNAAFARFKDLADKKHEIFDEDLQALVSDVKPQTVAEAYALEALEVTSKTGSAPKAQVSLTINGQVISAEAEGSGPVDATYKAIESLVASDTELKLYSVNAITEGTDSQGDVTVRLEKAGYIVNGVGADTDIVIASAKAYLHALNQMAANSGKAHPQREGV